MKSRQWLIVGLALLLAGAGPAAAENVVRFTGLPGKVVMDPHSSSWPNIRVATKQVYEQLLDIESNLAIVPQLAVAWKVVDLTHWDFELRQGVRFQDGTPFTAADVIFSIERAQAETSDFRNYVDGIAAVEALDERTIRVTTTGTDASLWLKLSEIAIMSRAWAEEHGVAQPTDYHGVRAESYALHHANGTGPFMVEASAPSGDYVLVRNPDWWGAADHPHNIDRIVHVFSTNDAEKVAALLEGKIDLLQIPPYWALDQIRGTPGLKVVHRPKLHTIFFGFDLGSAELRTSNIKGRNPFQDKRVREAMARALDMKSALQDLMGELFIPAGMIPVPGVNGHSAELNQPVPYDPARARALLAEAGYPDGFSVTLNCPADWGDDEIAECEAAARQLLLVGIEVTIDFLPEDEWEARVNTDRESDFHLDGWFMELDSQELLKKMYQSHNEWNVVGYANPKIDELIGKIEIDMLTYARDAYLEEAWTIVTNDFIYLPVRHNVSVFALREDLDIPPDPWDIPRFRLARFTGKSG